MNHKLIRNLIILFILLFCIGFITYESLFINVNGIIKCRDIRNITIDFPAYIDHFYVQEGQIVKYGDVLVSLNINEFETLINNKKQQLYDTIYESQKQNNNIKQLLNLLANQEKELDLSKKILYDNQKLFKIGAISQYELDECEKVVQRNKMNLTESQLKIESETKGISASEVKKRKIDNIEKEIELLNMKFKECDIDSNNNIITLFTNGIVYDIKYKDGDFIDSKIKLFSIINLDSAYIEAKIPENLIKYVKIDANAEIIPLAFSSRKYYGKVKAISAMAVNVSDETFFIVNIQIKNPDKYLAPNQNVNIKIHKNWIKI